MKKALVFLAVIVALSSFSVMAKDIEIKKFTPTMDGVISAGEYPDDSWFVLDKATAESYNGVWAGEMADGMQARYNFAWSPEGLYSVFEAVDTTPKHAESWDVHGATEGPAADGYQFNTGAIWITIGAYADGKLAARNHFSTDEDNLDGIVTGKATRDGDKFTIEAFIPWNKLVDYDVAAGTKVPLLFTYMDRNDAGENCYKNIDAAVWDGTTADTALVLADKTYEVPAPEAPAEGTEAPKTSDTGIMLALALVVASVVTFTAAKKSRVR